MFTSTKKKFADMEAELRSAQRSNGFLKTDQQGYLTTINRLHDELAQLEDQFARYRIDVRTGEMVDEASDESVVTLTALGAGSHVAWRRNIGAAPSPEFLEDAIEDAKAFGTELAGSRIPRFEGV